MKLHTHFILNFLIAILIGLTLQESLVMAFAGVLFDVDHLFTVLWLGIYNPRNMIKWFKKESKISRPHLFLFHTLEFFIIIFLVAYLIKSKIFYIISFGFLLNYLCDAITYISYYKSLKPWLKYYSLTSYILTK